MKIRLDLESVKENRWYEYAFRFFFGGAITVATGLIAKKFGPLPAGMFLAFPAIFPASATLISKHERERKEKAGKPGTRSGRALAGVDAAGAAIGSIGLVAFGAFVWKLLPGHSSWLILGLATLVWFSVSVALWLVRKYIRKYPGRRQSGATKI